MTVYTKDKAAKCRTAVLELLVKVGYCFGLFFLSPSLMIIVAADYKYPLINSVSQMSSELIFVKKIKFIGPPKNKGLQCCRRFPNM